MSDHTWQIIMLIMGGTQTALGIMIWYLLKEKFAAIVHQGQQINDVDKRLAVVEHHPVIRGTRP